MCLSGNLSVALLSRNEHVKAAVAAQPSLPLCCPDDIGLSKGDIEAGQKKGIRFLLFRYHDDQISKGKDQGFKTAFPRLALVNTLDKPPLEPGSKAHFRHATLTIELFDPKGDCAECEPNDGTEDLLEKDRRPRCAYLKTVSYLRRPAFAVK